MCRSKSPVATSPLNAEPRPIQGHFEAKHQGHHCPKCAKHIAPHSPQAARCLKAGHIQECPFHPGHYNGVRGFGRRDCPSCLVERQAKERQAKEAREILKKQIEEEEEKAFWSRGTRSRSHSVEGSSSEESCSSKGKKRTNKKQRR
jgi:hypothetical protein